MAILYNDASSFTVSTMESAEKYARDLGLTPVVRAYNGTAYPAGRILPLLQEVKREGIQWLLVMALDPDGLDATRAIQDTGMELAVKWVTIVPGGKFFLPVMGARRAEFFMVRRGARIGEGDCASVGLARRCLRDWPGLSAVLWVSDNGLNLYQMLMRKLLALVLRCRPSGTPPASPAMTSSRPTQTTLMSSTARLPMYLPTTQQAAARP